MNITIVCVGKLKEHYWTDAIKEYSKRLSKYCVLSIDETKEEKSPTAPDPISGDMGSNASQQPVMGQGQATTPAQKFQSTVSALPIGQATPFGNNAQLLKSQDGSVTISSPALRQPFRLDPSLPHDVQMQRMQAIFDITNAMNA